MREYERVKLIEDDVESDLEIIELEEKPVLKEIEVAEEKFMDEEEEQEGEEGQEGAEGLEGVDGDANVDDIPLDGEEEAAGGEPEEE